MVTPSSPVAPTNELPRGGWRISPVASRYTPYVDAGFVDCPSWYRILGQIIDARQVQVIRLPNAWYLDDGQSPLSAGAKWIDAGEAVDTARYHQLKNGIDPSVVWNLPPDVSPDQDEIDRVQAKISAKYGGPENVGRVMVAQNGTSVTPLTTSPKEMCYAEGFQDFKAAVLALHQTPPVAVGLQEPGAYAAYNASMKAWRHAAIQPLCDMLAESDTEHLAPQFGVGLTVEIESDTVDDLELTEMQLQNDLAAKVRTKNEWRAVRGLAPLPGPEGNDFVGTDRNELSSDRNSDSTTDTPSSNDDIPSAHSTKSHTQPPTESANTAFDSRTSTPFHGDANRQSPANPDEHQRTADDQSRTHSDETRVRADLLAELLYGLYGDQALSVLDTVCASNDKAFDPQLHPRDEQGRFTFRGSEEAIRMARQVISNILGGQTGLRTDQRILNALRLLTVPQLQSLHRDHGVKVPPRLRDRLIESIWVRLMKSPFDGDGHSPPIAASHTTSSRSVETYLQNENELHLILGRKFTPNQWGQLVGAQPGARVYVYPKSRASVGISIVHTDYQATRFLYATHIMNSDFEIQPDKQGQGIGTRILALQVKSATEQGFHSLSLTALGTGEALRTPGRYDSNNVGYYVWARLGFDGRIAPLMRQREKQGTEQERATVKDFRTKFPGVKLVSEMMKTQRGRDWWRRFGGEFEGTFSLKPGSASRMVLEKYVRRTTGKANNKSLLANEQTGIDWQPVHSLGEQPDQLTKEDEEILDEIWDDIGQETNTDESTDSCSPS